MIILQILGILALVLIGIAISFLMKSSHW